MLGQQLIMHKIPKIAGRNKIFKFRKKNYYNMKNHVQLYPILADFKRIDIILLIYKALYVTYPQQKHDFSHIFRLVCFFIAD